MKKAALLFFFIYSSYLFAQPITTIQGNIVDREYQTPIPYVTVKLLKETKSTISNSEGNFNLDISTATPKDTILFSSIGYKPLKITLETIQKEGLNIFPMTENKFY